MVVVVVITLNAYWSINTMKDLESVQLAQDQMQYNQAEIQQNQHEIQQNQAGTQQKMESLEGKVKAVEAGLDTLEKNPPSASEQDKKSLFDIETVWSVAWFQLLFG